MNINHEYIIMSNGAEYVQSKDFLSKNCMAFAVQFNMDYEFLQNLIDKTKSIMFKPYELYLINIPRDDKYIKFMFVNRMHKINDDIVYHIPHKKRK